MQIENDLNKIDISINKAKIESVTFNMRDGDQSLPVIGVCLSLISVGGNKITEVNLYTKGWNESTVFKADDISVEVYDHLARIVALLSPACIKKINSIDKFLSA